MQTLLRRHRFVVVGGIATRLYMPKRQTDDFDILIRATDREGAREELRAAGATYVGELRIPESSWKLPDGMDLDVLESNAAWIDQALEGPNVEQATGLPIIALPYLVLMKLDAGRVQDLADVSRMLGGADERAVSEVRAAVGRFLPDASEDFEGLVALGRLEHPSERPNAGDRLQDLLRLAREALDAETKHAAPNVKACAASLLPALEAWISHAPAETVASHARALSNAGTPSATRAALRTLLKEASEEPAVKSAYTRYLDAGRSVF